MAFLCTKKTQCHVVEDHPLTLGSFETEEEGLAGPTGRLFCTPKGIRTPVAGLKGLSPSPLDDGGVLTLGTRASLPELGVLGQMRRDEDRFEIVVSST